MDELVVLVNKRDEIIASIELERERANSRETTPKPTATPEPVKGKWEGHIFFCSGPNKTYTLVGAQSGYFFIYKRVTL